MTDEENNTVPMAECGACRTVIPLDSSECPECKTKFSGISDEALGECGACQKLVPLDSTRCPECSVVFVADDVVDILRGWVHNTGINIRKLFEKFDENGDGTIDADELRKGLLGLNLADLPPSQVDRLVLEIDADGNGVIDLDEFDAILMGDEGHASEATDSQSTANEPMDGEQDTSAEGHDTEESEAEEEDHEEHDEEDATDNMHEDDSDVEVDDTDEPTADDDDEDDEAEDTEAYVSEEDDGEDEGEAGAALHADGTSEETEETDEDEAVTTVHPLQALADMMDEHEISAQRMFNELDVDGNGQISLSELSSALVEKYGDMIDVENVEELIEGVDTDGDGMIDITEFIESLETLEDHEEVVKEEKPPKQFPTIWQKRMMSKTWNDNVWPIVHVAMGILITLVLVNALVGPVDGAGGSIVYQENGIAFPPAELNYTDGKTVYPCDNELQDGGCKNSLTPLAGENGASSMPKGFYWDGILFLLLSIGGLCASLFIHLVKAPGWRARVKAMKEVAGDKADATENGDTSDADDQEHEGAEAEDPDHEEDSQSEDEDEAAAEEGDDGEVDEVDEDEAGDTSDDDSIDVGSHIGLMLEDEEVYGTILEFDDDEGTVTIEEDGTGDLVTGYQDDMFVE
jgi:calcium-binding protein CML